MHTIENEDRTLSRFIETVQEQENRKQDFLANTAHLQFRTIAENDAEPTRLHRRPGSTFGLSSVSALITPSSLTRLSTKYSSVNQPSE